MQTSDEILAQWYSVRSKHPMRGQNMSPEAMNAIWESSSTVYTEKGYEVIRDEIVQHLVDNSVISSSDSLLDIGSGHGAFAIPFSKHVKSVCCTDISKGMLSRIDALGIPNVRTVLTDCFDASGSLVSDVSFSSLCPPMNGADGMMQMERMANKRCVYVASTNSCPGIEIEVWKALGKDYSYSGSDPNYPYMYLKSLGRSPELNYFTQKSELVSNTGDLVRSMTNKMVKYGITDGKSMDIIREVVVSHDQDGNIVQDKTMTLGLLVWDVPE